MNHCNLPCLKNMRKSSLIKIARNENLKINEKLDRETLRDEIMVRLGRRLGITFSKIPTRRFLEMFILPCLKGPILFIGWDPSYNGFYKKICKMKTVDYDAKTNPDVVLDITTKNIKKKKIGIYNSIIFSGVISYGVNTDKAIKKALKNCASLLKKGGTIIIGWNNRWSWVDELKKNVFFSESKIRKLTKPYFSSIKSLKHPKDAWKHRYLIAIK